LLPKKGILQSISHTILNAQNVTTHTHTELGMRQCIAVLLVDIHATLPLVEHVQHDLQQGVVRILAVDHVWQRPSCWWLRNKGNSLSHAFDGVKLMLANVLVVWVFFNSTNLDISKVVAMRLRFHCLS